MITSEMKVVRSALQTFTKYKMLTCSIVLLSFSLIILVSLNAGKTGNVNTKLQLYSANSQSGKKLLLPGNSELPDLSILGRSDQENEWKLGQSPSTENNEPIVKISRQGRVRGRILQSREGKNYFGFYKIPYAQPPVGNLRFEAPKKPRRWRGILDATQPGRECIQKEKYAPEEITAGDEDCLYLNIYTPELPSKDQKKSLMPVLFYIHGGGVYGNGTRYGAKYFMDEPVVLVTFEFRLGILAQFTLGTSDFPGNLGGRDRIMALQWVRKNIEKFGGDPTRILIFGNSSGGSLVHELILSPLAAGLFSAAILQSATVLPRNKILRNSVTTFLKIADEVGCGDQRNNTRRLLKCLKQVEVSKFVLHPKQPRLEVATLEPWSETDSYMPDYPWVMLQNGAGQKVPIISGTNYLESIDSGFLEKLKSSNDPADFETQWNTYLPAMLNITDDENHSIAKDFYSVYIGESEVSPVSITNSIWNLTSDGAHHEARLAGMLHAENTASPVYFYYMTKEPPKSYAARQFEMYPGVRGASHADELQYLFLYDGFPEITKDSPWFLISKNMVHIWATFAATGKPDPPTGQWEPLDLADGGMKWFELGDEMKTVEPFTDRMLLWDKYIPQLYAVASVKSEEIPS